MSMSCSTSQASSPSAQYAVADCKISSDAASQFTTWGSPWTASRRTRRCVCRKWPWMKAWLVVDSVEKARDTSFCMVMPRTTSLAPILLDSVCSGFLALLDSCSWLSGRSRPGAEDLASSQRVKGARRAALQKPACSGWSRGVGTAVGTLCSAVLNLLVSYRR